MIDRQEFRIGFLQALAERGVSPDVVGTIYLNTQLCKRADLLAALTAGMVPFVAGGAGGYALGNSIGRSLAGSIDNPEDFARAAKHEQLVSNYLRAATVLREKVKQRKKSQETFDGGGISGATPVYGTFNAA